MFFITTIILLIISTILCFFTSLFIFLHIYLTYAWFVLIFSYILKNIFTTYYKFSKLKLWLLAASIILILCFCLYYWNLWFYIDMLLWNFFFYLANYLKITYFYIRIYFHWVFWDTLWQIWEWWYNQNPEDYNFHFIKNKELSQHYTPVLYPNPIFQSHILILYPNTVP